MNDPLVWTRMDLLRLGFHCTRLALGIVLGMASWWLLHQGRDEP